MYADGVSDLVELCLGASGQEDPGAFAGKRTGHRPADRTARAIDRGDFVLE